MNKKKRRVAVLLSATIGSAVLVLSGCSGKSDQTEKTQIGRASCRERVYVLV